MVADVGVDVGDSVVSGGGGSVDVVVDVDGAVVDAVVGCWLGCQHLMLLVVG